MISKQLAQFEIFPWHKNFETGISHIDEQHKKLVSILNKLAIHLANRSSDIVLDAIFAELVAYTDYHFSSEEEVWNTYLAGDPWCTSHEHTHESFIDRVKEIKETESHKPLDDVVQEIVSFLSHWLGYHILDTDKRMALVVQNLRAGKPIEEAKAIANETMSGAMKVLIETVLTMYDSLSLRTLELMREKALRWQAEQALLKSEQRLDVVVQDRGESIWEWDMKNETKTISVHHTPFFSFLQKRKASSSDTKSIISIHPKDLNRIESDLQNHLDGKTEFFVTEYRVLLEDGSWSWVNSRGKVVERDELGTATRMVGAHSDITEREIGSMIFHQSYQAVIVADEMANIVSVNPAFCEITGYKAADVIGKEAHLLLPDDKKKALDNINRGFDTVGFWKGELPAKRKNGKTFIAMANITPIRTLPGTTDHFVILFTDISENKAIEKELLQAKEKAEAANHLKAQFINNISHEVRTPMNGIIGFSKLLSDPKVTEQQREQFISLIQSSGKQLLHIIDDIMEISQLDGMQIKIKDRPVCLNAFLRDTFMIFNMKAKEKEIQLNLNLGSSDLESTISSDEVRLAKIVHNLLENALKFTSRGFVEFGYTLKENKVELFVKDSGIGIVPENHSMIFERFTQTKRGLMQNAGGLGLGLSIVKESVDLLGGRVSVQSEENKGATFLVTIPYRTTASN